MSEWGNLFRSKRNGPAEKRDSEPAEVKHPSKQRKRKQSFIPLVAASEKGRAQTPPFLSFSNFKFKIKLEGILNTQLFWKI